MIGEITDDTNSADAFALLHVPWVTGYSFGFVVFMKPQSWSLIPVIQGTHRWMACKAARPLLLFSRATMG